MDRDRECRQLEEPPAGDRQGIQPVVSISDLVQFQDSTEARRLARLEADSTLMLRLSAEGFQGAAWREVSRALVEYGFTVMRAWVVTGQVFVKLKEKNRKVSDPPSVGIIRADALMLAEDTVADAIVHFRDEVLKRGYWNPSRGASLTTFFIGDCLMFQFPNVYRKWRVDYIKLRRAESINVDEDQQDHHVVRLRAKDDPASEVIGADETSRMIAMILEPISDDTNKAILVLRSEGYGIDEIAETLGLEYDAVESRIYRARKKLKERKGA